MTAGNDLPPDLMTAVQNATGFPWWNGKAWAEYHGYPQAVRGMRDGIGDAVDDLASVIDWLREERQFDKADRLRTVAGRLARSVPVEFSTGNPELVREIARNWR